MSAHDNARMSGGSAASAAVRVVVTGLGVLTPAGADAAAGRAWLRAPQHYGRQVPGFDAAHYIPSAKLRRSMNRSFELMAAAAVLAMRAAGLPEAASLPAAGVAPERAGIASALTDLSPLSADLLRVLEQTAAAPAAAPPIAWGPFAELALHQLHPFRRLTLLANMAVAHTSLLFGLQGPSFTFTSGAAAGLQAITEAAWTIAGGRADLMICHTADAPEQTFAATPPAEAAGALVLESWTAAQRRQAPIRAELLLDPSIDTALEATPAPAPAGFSPVPGFLAALLALDAAPAAATVPLAQLRRPPMPALGEAS